MKTPTHVAGTFLVFADGSFLNGAGLGEGENRNVTVTKTLRDLKDTVPYVSSQAWKRWLRNTLIEETGWPASELRAIDFNEKKGSTSKISGELDPVSFAEDDLFGYMRAQEGQGRRATSRAEDAEDEEPEADATPSKKTPKTKALVRASPFSASLLISLRKTGWRGRDEGFVHLKEGTPLPYTTEFYTTHLQGVFCLAHYRVARFENAGDRIELEESKAKRYVAEGKLLGSGTSYELPKASDVRKERSGALLKALSVLRGGAKQAAFGTDVAPKVLILAGLNCGNPIFNHLFDEESSTGLAFRRDVFLEVLNDYADRIVTPVCVGIRSDYLSNQAEVKALAGTHPLPRGEVTVQVSTPREAAESMASWL
jgi:CRISPR-associated protein Cst2